MRDQLKYIQAFQNKWKVHDILNGTSWEDNAAIKDVVTRHRFRSDSVATTPNKDGSYGIPTHYNAFKYALFPGSNLLSREDLYTVFGPCSTSVEPYRHEISETWLAPRAPIGYAHVNMTGDWDANPSLPSGLVSKATASVNNQIRQKSWSISQSLGELPKTVDFLTSTAKTLLLGYNAVRTGNIRKGWAILGAPKNPGAWRFSKSAADNWLQMQYGWKPLINDIYQAANAIENGLNKPLSKPIYSRQEKDLKASWDDFQGTFHDGLSIIERNKTGTAVAKCGCEIRIDNETLASLGSHGLLNPAALAWELYPMSFVIDWFLPIKPFLEGMMGHMGISISNGYLTKYVDWTCESEVKYVPMLMQCASGPSGTGESWHIIQGHHGRRRTSDFRYSESLTCFKREILPFIPPPVPYFKLSINESQAVSLLALVRSLRG